MTTITIDEVLDTKTHFDTFHDFLGHVRDLIVDLDLREYKVADLSVEHREALSEIQKNGTDSFSAFQ